MSRSKCSGNYGKGWHDGKKAGYNQGREDGRKDGLGGIIIEIVKLFSNKK